MTALLRTLEFRKAVLNNKERLLYNEGRSNVKNDSSSGVTEHPEHRNRETMSAKKPASQSSRVPIKLNQKRRRRTCRRGKSFREREKTAAVEHLAAIENPGQLVYRRRRVSESFLCLLPI